MFFKKRIDTQIHRFILTLFLYFLFMTGVLYSSILYVNIPDSSGELIRSGIDKIRLSAAKTGYDLIVNEKYLSQYPDNADVLDVRLNRTKSIDLKPDGYCIDWQKRDGHFTGTIRAVNDRGLLYGMYDFAGRLEIGETQKEFSIVENPYFKHREWLTMAFQGNFNLPLGGAFDRAPEELLAGVKRILHSAPEYRINALQLHGRPGEEGVDIHWFVKYRKFPGLYKYYCYNSQRDERVRYLRDICQYADKYGVDVLAWDHELVYPSQLKTAYPEIVGPDGKLDLNSPMIKRFLEGKVGEFFEIVPEIDGIVLMFSEVGGGVNIFNAGTREDAAQRISMIVNTVAGVCRQYGKRLEVRTYYTSRVGLDIIRKAAQKFTEEVIVDTKCSPYDFFGTDRLTNPLIGTFSQDQIIEFTLARESNGHKFIPNLTPNDFKNRLNDGARKGVAGAVGRLDYHHQFSHYNGNNPGRLELTMDTVNEFNIFVFSRLLWNPDSELDSLWREWALNKYGAEAAPVMIRCLKRTEEISQKIFFSKGEYVLHQHTMVPRLSYIESSLTPTSPRSQAYWAPQDALLSKTAKELRNPTKQIIDQLVAEKQTAIQLCDVSLDDLESVQHLLPAGEFERLQHDLLKERETAILWKYLTELYFNYRMFQNLNTFFPTKLTTIGNDYLVHIKNMEKEFGRVWPVYSSARGINAYQFIQQIWSPWFKVKGVDALPVFDIWSRIIALTVPYAQSNQICFLYELPENIKQIVFEHRSMMVHMVGGKIEIPLGTEIIENNAVLKNKGQLKAQITEKGLKLIIVP